MKNRYFVGKNATALHNLWGVGLDSATWHRLGRALWKHLWVLLGLTVMVMVGKILARVIVIQYLKSLGSCGEYH